MADILLYIDLALVLLLSATLFVVAHLIREVRRLNARTSPRYLDESLGRYIKERSL